MNSSDVTTLRNGQCCSNICHLIGQDKADESKIPNIKDYMTYDEIKLAALMQVSCYVKPINSGNRYNRAILNHGTPCDKEAVYIGAVGPRFERPGFMEWQEIIEDPVLIKFKETSKVPISKRSIEELFMSFYKSNKNIIEDSSQSKYSKETFSNSKKFNTITYQKRIAISAETFLLEANERGKSKNTDVHVIIVGLGLGVWQVSSAQVCRMLTLQGVTTRFLIYTEKNTVGLFSKNHENTSYQE